MWSFIRVHSCPFAVKNPGGLARFFQIAVHGTVEWNCGRVNGSWQSSEPNRAGVTLKESMDSHEKAQETQNQQITEMERFTRLAPFCADHSATEDSFFVLFVLPCG